MVEVFIFGTIAARDEFEFDSRRGRLSASTRTHVGARRDTSGVTSLLTTMDAYASTASWAVWPDCQEYTARTDLRLPVDDLDGVLHARSVILGLNRGDPRSEPVPWGNFHTAGGHNDHFLAVAFKGTAHWGAYMTDLLSEVNSKSRTLDLRDATLEADIADLIGELQVLMPANPLFILIGKQTARSFDQHRHVLARALGQDGVRSVTLPHYSAANGRVHGNSPQRYRDLVAAALATAPM